MSDPTKPTYAGKALSKAEQRNQLKQQGWKQPQIDEYEILQLEHKIGESFELPLQEFVKAWPDEEPRLIEQALIRLKKKHGQ